MVIASHLRRRSLTRDTEGAVLVEALLVVPLLILFLAMIIETMGLFIQWNQSAKAMQIGARLASVSDPLVDITSLNTQPTGRAQGDAMPLTGAVVRCGAGTGTVCDTDGLQRILTGSNGACGGGGPMLGICDVAGFIQADDIRVTYQNTGLGYVGRPSGPVVSVTVETVDMEFEFLFLRDILRVFGSVLGEVRIPPHPVTIVSEDLSSCEGACP